MTPFVIVPGCVTRVSPGWLASIIRRIVKDRLARP
jgi:hypothetical protein